MKQVADVEVSKKYVVKNEGKLNFELRFMLGLEDDLDLFKRGQKFSLLEWYAAFKGVFKRPLRTLNYFLRMGYIEGKIVTSGESSRELWKDPDYRDEMSKFLSYSNRERWEDHEYRAKLIPSMIEASKAKWRSRKYRGNMSKAITKKWKDPKYRNKAIANREESKRESEKTISSIVETYDMFLRHGKAPYVKELYLEWLKWDNMPSYWKRELSPIVKSYMKQDMSEAQITKAIAEELAGDGRWQKYYRRFKRYVKRSKVDVLP